MSNCVFKKVTILFQCFTERELHPEEGTEDEQDLGGLLQEINSYNRRFSNQFMQASFGGTTTDILIMKSVHFYL